MRLEDYLLEDDHYIQSELDIMIRVIEFIKSLDDDLDDESYNAIGEAYESLLDVIISLEDDELDDESNNILQNIFLDIEDMNPSDENANESYKPRKVAGGKKRSSTSRMTGPEKMKYIKRLKANKKKYKTDAALRLKTKKKGKKYRKTAKAKQVSRVYKHFNK